MSAVPETVRSQKVYHPKNSFSPIADGLLPEPDIGAIGEKVIDGGYDIGAPPSEFGIQKPLSPAEKRRKKRQLEASPTTALEITPHGLQHGVIAEATREMIFDPELLITVYIGPMGSGKSSALEQTIHDINSSDTEINGQMIYARPFAYDTYRRRHIERTGKITEEWNDGDSMKVENAFFADIANYFSPSRRDKELKTKKKAVIELAGFDDGTVTRGIETLTRLIDMMPPGSIRIVALAPVPMLLEQAIISRDIAIKGENFIDYAKEKYSVTKMIGEATGGQQAIAKLQEQMQKSGNPHTVLDRLHSWYKRILYDLEGMDLTGIERVIVPPYAKKLGPTAQGFFEQHDIDPELMIKAFTFWFQEVFPRRIGYYRKYPSMFGEKREAVQVAAIVPHDVISRRVK